MEYSILIIGVVVVIGILGFSWVIADRAMSKAASIPPTSLRRDKRWRRQLAYRIPLIAIAMIPLIILGAMLLTVQFQTLTYLDFRSFGLLTSAAPCTGNRVRGGTKVSSGCCADRPDRRFLARTGLDLISM